MRTNNMFRGWRYWLSLAVAVVLFLVVSLACFKPLLEGLTLPMHDIEQFDGMSRDIREHRATYDEDPQWTGAMFGGMPAYMINIKYPAQIIKSAGDSVVGLFDSPAGMIFFAMVSALLMMLMMGYSPWIGMVVGLAYGLSTYFFLIIGAGHITKMWALVYAPPMLGAIYMTLRRNMWLGGALAALFAALEIGANHIQITYYFLLVALLLWLNDLVISGMERRLKEFAKRTGVLLAAALLALSANFAPLYYAATHTKDTMRGGSEVAEKEQDKKGLDLKYATQWSYGKSESLNMLIPNLMGGDTGKHFEKDGVVAGTIESKFNYPKQEASKLASEGLITYWGAQPGTAGPTYIGAVVLFLALLGLLLASNRNRWWILAASILGLLLAWGSNLMWFTEFCFEHLPFYNKFRTVSMALVIIELTAPLLAGIALWKLIKATDLHIVRAKIAIATILLGGTTLIFALFGGEIFDFTGPLDRQMLDEEAADILKDPMAQERAALLTADAWRSFFFIILTAGVAFAFTLREKIGSALTKSSSIVERVSMGLLMAAAALLVVADIAPVNKRYLPDERFVEPRTTVVKPSSADKTIMADFNDGEGETGFRVLNQTVDMMNDASTSMFHRSVGGYHGAKLGRYQDLISKYGSDIELYNMLNTRYIIYLNDAGSPTAFKNDGAYGAAWFVEDVIEATSAEEELAFVGELMQIPTDTVSRQTLLRCVAVVASEEHTAAQCTPTDGRGEMRLTEYRPNYLRYEYNLTGGDATAVFSEIYYDKGWTAYIDGVEAPYFRANYVLRGMRLPEGQHVVEWRFRAPHWKAVEGVTLCGSILIILALIAATLHTTGLGSRLINRFKR